MLDVLPVMTTHIPATKPLKPATDEEIVPAEAEKEIVDAV